MPNRFVVQAGNWPIDLDYALRTFKDGDVIVVPFEIMIRYAESRMEKLGISKKFIFEVPEKQKPKSVLPKETDV